MGHLEDLRQRIAQVTLTRKESEIAEFILNNASRVCFMSTRELAEELGTSDATVIRTARAIGYSSFLELQKMLQDGMSRQIDDAEHVHASPLKRIIHKEGHTAGKEAMEQFNNLMAQNLISVFSKNTPEKLERVAELMLASRCKYISGQRPTASLAAKFGFLLRMTTDRVQVVDDAYALEQILDIEEGDCLFVIDFTPHSQHALQLLQYAGQRKAETILLTDKTSSPLSRCANEILVADVKGTSFFNSNVAPLFLLEYLAGRMAEKNMEQTKHRLNILEPYFESHRAVKTSKPDVHPETTEKKENET